jgi:molybdopterin-guanine dinucleotide biosynthesis protein A
MTVPPWSGAVLCGGRSRRMGRDKALLTVDGEPMARRVASALRAAGAVEVIAVGGDAAALAAAGLTVVPDDPALAGGPPGDGRPWSPGPLVGITTALGALPTRVVMVVACDLVSPSPAAMAATVAALTDDAGDDAGQGPGAEAEIGADAGADPGPGPGPADLAVPDGDGRRQWLHAAWRRSSRPRLLDALAAGERSVHGGVARAGLRAAVVRGLDPQALVDADVPGDLPRRVD